MKIIEKILSYVVAGMVVFGLIALSCAAFAEDRLMADTYTKHSSVCQTSYGKTCERWQQPHRLSWQHDFDNDLSSDIGIGTNSYGKLSANIGGMWLPLKAGPVSFGAFGALATGYDCNQLRTCFIVGGVASSVVMGGLTMQVLYVPAVGGGTVSVVNVRMGMQF